MNKKSAALIFIGATEFDGSRLTSRLAFLNSKRELERYFDSQSAYEVVKRLDLFGARESASRQVSEVDNFVYQISELEVEYLFVVYIGHGIIRANKDDYFWAIAATNNDNQFASAIDVNTLGHSLKKLRKTTKCICIVDCCFSAATASALQSDQALENEVSRRTKASIAKVHGALVISSSAIDNVSYISGVEEKTLFGRALMAVLMPEEIIDGVIKLDAASLIDRCERWMEQEEPERKTNPQLIAPFQQGESLLKEELFAIASKMPHLNAKAHAGPVMKADNNTRSDFYPSRDEIDEIRDIVRLGQELEREIVLSIDKSLLKEDLYAYYARTKGAESVARKIERKRAAIAREKKDVTYSVGSVTDVVGVRLITLFRDDIAGILHGICNILVGTNGKREEITRYNPFTVPPEISEARAYFSDTFPGAHGYAVDAQEILSSYFEKSPHNIRAEIIHKDEYSSVHIVLRATIGKTDSSRASSLIVPVEFQVRSVFEDTWAQIDHKLRYTKTRVSSEGEEAESVISEREDIPPSAERSLKLLKRFLDNSGDLAEIIRDEVENDTPEFSKPTPSMDSAEDFSQTIISLGAEPKEFDEFRSILLKKDELDSAYKELGSPEAADQRALEKLRKNYGKLAEDLNSLFEAASSRQRFAGLASAGEVTRFYYYSLRMEEAFCRVFSARPGDLSEVKEARNIYSQLAPDFSDFAPLHFRMSQAQKSTGDLPRAIKSMEKAIICLEKGKYFEGSFDHRLTKKQFETLKDNADRILGFYIWSRADAKIKDAEGILNAEIIAETLKSYDEALKITLRGLRRSSPEMRKRTLNNIVAYLNDAISLLGSIDDVGRLESMEGYSYEEFFDEFAAIAKPNEDTSIKRLETLATGYKILGKSEDARSCSARIIGVITKNKLIATGEIPPHEIQEILDIALKIMDDE